MEPISSRNREAPIKLFLGLAEPIFGNWLGKRGNEFLLQIRQFDSVLWPFRTGHARHHGPQIEIKFDGIVDLALLRHSEQSLGAGILLINPAMLVAATSGPQISHALLVNWEETHRRSIFRRHVGDGGAVHHRQCCGARPVELHKFAHNFRLAQHLGDR